ncbi:MAG: CDP-glucose 4,6-dehydratase [Thermoprotei archaeon]
MYEKLGLLDFYRGRRVLVTGHTGFKGSWLSLWLLRLGAEVVGYSLDPQTPYDNFVVSRLHEKIVDIRGDVRDFQRVVSVFEEYAPEIVFHLAAQPIVRVSYDIPRETVDTNVMGTTNLLEAFRGSSKSRTLVIITSDKVYENKEWVWGYREIDALGGYDPYSASKAASELIAAAYARSFFDPKDHATHGKAVATARAGNVVGGGDWEKDRLIPDCVRALEDNRPIEVRNPTSTRPWQFVLEPLYGYLLLPLKLQEDPVTFSGAWNFGPSLDMLVPVSEVVELFIRKYGKGSWKPVNGGKLHESRLLNLDASKARHLLGWKPRLTLEQTIEMTVEWYKSYRDSERILRVINDTLDKYSAMQGET